MAMSGIEKFMNEMPLSAIFVVFWAGAVSSLSSCTIVRLPVVVGYMAGAGGSKRRTLLTTIFFVLGLIVSYTVLGTLFAVVAELPDRFIRVNKYFYWVLGVLMFVAGLLVSGLTGIRVKTFKCGIGRDLAKISFIGAFLFGIVFALVELPGCPCCGGVMLVIASIVAARGFSVYAVFIFLSFAIGQSFPILAVGILTSLVGTDLINYLAKSVHRMEACVRLVAGNILMLLGVYTFIIA
jgi:cytochrome c-type biogenesis protein